MAARAAAPPGSATILTELHKASWARRIAASLTRTTLATPACAMGNMSLPTRRGASESAAMPPAGASTGRPALSASESVGAVSGSTPTIVTVPPYQPAMPPNAATTPAAGSGRRSRLANAPRALNDPECCSSSSLSTSGKDETPKSAPLTSSVGVARTYGAMIAATLSMLFRSTLLVTRASSRECRAVAAYLDMDLVNWQSGEYAFRRRGQGAGQRAPPPDPRLAPSAARPLPAAVRRRPRARRRLRRVHRREAG